jgi:hypothetical protein
MHATRTLTFAVAVLAGMLTAVSGSARADEPIAGPFKFDFKLGPSIGASSANTQFRIEPHFGYNFTPNETYHIYLDAPLEFGLGGGYKLIGIVPGVEADILLPVGQPLYIYPMGGLGIDFVFISDCPACDTQTAFTIRFGAGIKYILNGRWNFMFEPVGIEILAAGITGATPVLYNLLFGAGVNF